jgi:crotonobetainyl-CoA:carnitine CoA-transferase CaiB-like acyl-CoA transferase
MASDTTEALSGIRVLDASASVAGQFAARLFADNGAATLLLEPPEGSPLRRVGPFVPGADGAPRSTLFAHLNAGKAGIVADSSDRSRIADLVARAEVVVVDDAGSWPIREDDVRGTLCRVTPFGAAGSETVRGWRGSELVYQALAGPMYENGRVEGPPLYGVGHRASYAAGAIAYLQSVATLLGGGLQAAAVDVAITEVAAAMSFNRITQFSYNGEIEGRDIRTIPRALVRCADGWVSIFIYDNRWRQACRGLGLQDLVDDPRFATESSRLKHWPEFTSELDRRLANRSADDVVAAGQRERAVVARAMAPSELRDEPQLVARGYWDRTKPGELPRLGPMVRMSDTPQQDHGPAPAPGVTAVPPVWQQPAPQRAARMGKGRPLDGIRVLDLTTAWSGPMVTRLLASLGAAIVKVEGPQRIDDWRGPIGGGHPARYPDGVPGERPFDRCYQFNTQNHDKRSLVVDLKTEQGLAIVRKLAEQADVMIANFSVGTLERMGLGWETVHALNPRLIVAEMPAYGAGGPVGDHVALGPSMEMMAGMARIIGYGDGRPVTTGPAYLDPMGGFNGAAAVLTALAARERTGRGQYVEMAQREAAMHWIGEEIVYAVATGQDRLPHGNRLPGVAPHDALRSAGEDEWVAIAAFDDAEFAALARVIGRPELASDPKFATAECRVAYEDDLTAILGAWTATRDKHDIAARLQAAGVHAAPVQCARDLNASRYFRDRGLTQRVRHPLAGEHDYQGVPLHIAVIDLSIRKPAPCFGQHNDEVLGELGYDAAAIAALRDGGVIAERPTKPK